MPSLFNRARDIDLQSVDPSNPSAGQIWLDDQILKYRNTNDDFTHEVIVVNESQTLFNKDISIGHTQDMSGANQIRGDPLFPYQARLSGQASWRIGTYTAQSNTGASGLMSGLTSLGATNANFLDSTEGFGQDYTTGAVIGNQAGIKQTSARWRAQWECYLVGRFRIPSTTGIGVFFGWSSSSADIATATPLDNLSGAGIGRRSTDTNWQVIRNDGDATTDYTDTGVAVGTAFITFEIQLNTGLFQTTINDVTESDQTTELPAAATNLFLHVEAESIDGGDKTFSLLPILGRHGDMP